MRIRQEENEALRLLKKHLPHYMGLVSSDKPDLIDYEKSLGVEVVCAVNETIEKQEAHFYKNLNGKGKHEVPKKSSAEFERFGLRVASIKEDGQEASEKMYTLIRICGLEEKELLHRAISAKYTKEYQKLDSIDLYIFFRHMCRRAMTKDDFDALLQTAHNCEAEHGKVFRKIMIDFYSDLVILDLECNSVCEITDYGD